MRIDIERRHGGEKWIGSDQQIKELARLCGGLLIETYSKGMDCDSNQDSLYTFLSAMLDEGTRGGVHPNFIEGMDEEIDIPWAPVHSTTRRWHQGNQGMTVGDHPRFREGYISPTSPGDPRHLRG